MTSSPSTPILFCLCGPSGVGKSTISRELLKKDSKLLLSISATTRSPRSGEVEGEHYYFYTKEKFEQQIKLDHFLEWAVYNEQYYGTPLQNLEDASKRQMDLLLDIDVQGAQKLKAVPGKNVVVVFIKPPSIDLLRERLVGRGSESEEVVVKRLKRAEEEFKILESSGLTDHTVVNDGLDAAVAAVEAALEKERHESGS